MLTLVYAVFVAESVFPRNSGFLRSIGNVSGRRDVRLYGQHSHLIVTAMRDFPATERRVFMPEKRPGG